MLIGCMGFGRGKSGTMPRGHQAVAASHLMCFRSAGFACRGNTSH